LSFLLIYCLFAIVLSMINSTPSYLAKNVIQLRTTKGYTQSALSEKANIPRSTITNIESGTANPSLLNLLALANALQVNVEELLTRPRKSIEHIHAEDIPMQLRMQGKARILKLLPDKIRGMNIDMMVLDAGIHMPGHAHLKGTKEYLTVIEGEITVMIEGIITVVKKGDVLAFEGDQAHAYKNSGAKQARAVSIVIPLLA
jgi:transcriptional regulator with XRE-family HTH domain